jgi:lipoprotein-releasing system ATP-binding protein
MLRAEDIHRNYGELQVLKGVSINVKKGEIVSIVGPSGAGKSTFLHILGSIDKPDRGFVYLDEICINLLNEKKLAAFRNNNFGFIFQFHHLLPEFTALENVSMPAYIARKSKDEIVKRARYLLDLMKLSERLNHKPNELSGGEQQRVAVARALMNNPSVILADEPSGNLDTQTATDLHRLFFELRDEFEQTFVIVTHNEELAGMADRKLTMVDGKLV